MTSLYILLGLGFLVAIRYGAFRGRWWMSDRPLVPALIAGALAGAAGFLGPIFFAPGANQGPLLGVFITGPIGFCIGLLWGTWREWRRHRSDDNMA